MRICVTISPSCSPEDTDPWRGKEALPLESVQRRPLPLKTARPDSISSQKHTDLLCTALSVGKEVQKGTRSKTRFANCCFESSHPECRFYGASFFFIILWKILNDLCIFHTCFATCFFRAKIRGLTFLDSISTFKRIPEHSLRTLPHGQVSPHIQRGMVKLNYIIYLTHHDLAQEL